MSNSKPRTLILIVAGCVVWLLHPLSSLGVGLKPEEVVSRHLESIGTPEARAAAKSRVMESTVHFKMLIGGAGLLDGTSVLISEQRKLQFMLKISGQAICWRALYL